MGDITQLLHKWRDGDRETAIEMRRVDEAATRAKPIQWAPSI